MTNKNNPSLRDKLLIIDLVLALVSLLTVYFTTLFVLGTTLNF